MQRVEQIKETYSRLAHHRRAYRHRHIWLNRWRAATKIFAEKTKILDRDPSDLFRREHTKGQAELSSVGFSWWAKPGTIGPLLIAMGHFLCQTKQVFFHLALDPPCPIILQDKEVWC